jgi:AbrB family looped-hinge helix DNA binding protein
MHMGSATDRPLVPQQNTAAAPFHGYVTVQGRGTVALPAGLRKRLHLDRPGAQVEITEREDGVLELRPTLAVPANEAWFWEERWQAGERQVDAHVAAGEVTRHEDAEDFLAALDALDDE